MGAPDRRAWLETLRATPARLAKALEAAPRKLIGRRPTAGKWSMLEIVCHLRDVEQCDLGRCRRILEEEHPLLPNFDADLVALERGYRGQDATLAFNDWSRTRHELLALLEGLGDDESAWARSATHETEGRLSLEELLQHLAVGNDEGHLGQIEALERRFAILARLASAPQALAKATRGLPGEALRRRARADSWSITEIACHLRDVEEVFAGRFVRMAFSERPIFWVMDNDRMAARKNYRASDFTPVLAALRRARGETLALLEGLPPATWQRSGVHPERGELTLEALAQFLSEHDARHLARVRELAASSKR